MNKHLAATPSVLLLKFALDTVSPPVVFGMGPGLRVPVRSSI